MVLTPGPDGAIWFSRGDGLIGRVDPAGTLVVHAGANAGWVALRADGRIEEFPLPDRSCRPHAIAATADGGCWATLWAASSVIRLDRAGHLVEETRFQAGAEPHGIALAADGTLWVALEAGFLAHLSAEPGPRASR